MKGKKKTRKGCQEGEEGAKAKGKRDNEKARGKKRSEKARKRYEKRFVDARSGQSIENPNK